MKKFTQLLVLFFVTFGLTSCLPEADSNGNMLYGLGDSGNSGGGTTPTVSKYLSKVTLPDDAGVLYSINYIYTGNKLTAVTTSNNSFSYVINYDSSNVINKIIKTEKDNTGQITTTNSNLIYTGTQLTKVIGDMQSGGIVVQDFITNFTYNSTQISKIKTEYFMVGTLVTTLTSDVTYGTDNNIKMWKMETGIISLPPITIPPIIVTSSFSNYDNSISPFSTLPKIFNLAVIHNETENGNLLGFNKNNPKNISITTDSGIQNETIVYTYDSDGYPSTFTAQGETIKFEYIKL